MCVCVFWPILRWYFDSNVPFPNRLDVDVFSDMSFIETGAGRGHRGLVGRLAGGWRWHGPRSGRRHALLGQGTGSKQVIGCLVSVLDPQGGGWSLSGWELVGSGLIHLVVAFGARPGFEDDDHDQDDGNEGSSDDPDDQDGALGWGGGDLVVPVVVAGLVARFGLGFAVVDVVLGVVVLVDQLGLVAVASGGCGGCGPWGWGFLYVDRAGVIVLGFVYLLPRRQFGCKRNCNGKMVFFKWQLLNFENSFTFWFSGPKLYTVITL